MSKAVAMLAVTPSVAIEAEDSDDASRSELAIEFCSVMATSAPGRRVSTLNQYHACLHERGMHVCVKRMVCAPRPTQALNQAKAWIPLALYHVKPSLMSLHQVPSHNLTSHSDGQGEWETHKRQR